MLKVSTGRLRTVNPSPSDAPEHLKESYDILGSSYDCSLCPQELDEKKDQLSSYHQLLPDLDQ